MNAQVNAVSARLSLRPPQREALEILARVADLVPLTKGGDTLEALAKVQSLYPQVEEFERDFPSLCFALATGVGKTRLMGAFIAYLHRARGLRHFFVLAPNLTIYNKLIADFTPGTPKYVFQGLGEFALNPPDLITGDNYAQSGSVARLAAAGQMRTEAPVQINVFNVSKINSEVRGGKAPRIKRLSEYIGESYFEYLARLDDLVLLMDEAHRYRASAGLKAINDLRPVLGLELTATPQVEKGSKSVPFRNVVYNYPLSAALRDGYVKEPAVATRENFDRDAYTKEELEKLKLHDAVLIHEETKVQLDLYARQSGQRRVKPFVLVVAEDTAHASALKAMIESEEFFAGQYRGKVIEVHSQTKGEEGDEVVQQLLSVEDPANPVEVVVHVNMLKEGWDVTNLYTVVPLRAANSKTLVEQSIGRGLRLPYGRRVGVPAVDRLTIVSHDNFQAIVDEARNPDSLIRAGVVIGRDVPEQRSQVLTVEPLALQRLQGNADSPAFATATERAVALATYEVIHEEFEALPSSGELNRPEVRRQVAERVRARLAVEQPDLSSTGDDAIAEVVGKAIEVRNELSIDVPRILVVPKGETRGGFRDFDLDCSNVRLRPVPQDILIQHLHDWEQQRLSRGETGAGELRPEDHLVRGLAEFDDVDYDAQAELLYKLAGQVVAHLRSYLPTEEDVLNVLQAHRASLVQAVHRQMQDHREEAGGEYEVRVARGFTTLRANHFTIPAGESVRDFREPVGERSLIRGMLFGGFRRCLYPAVKFDSDSERRLAVVLENDPAVRKWFRPSREDFRIQYASGQEYVPDFAAEADDACYLLEPKASDETDDAVVLAKAKAAALWCERATEHAGGKPWRYLLIPHDAIDETKTLAGLVATWEVRAGDASR